MNKLKVGFFQYAVFSKDREANLDYIEKSLKQYKFDLLVLPELFTSGYAFDNPKDLLIFGEDLADSVTVRRLQSIATYCGGAITGTIPELSNGVLYNTAILVSENGLIASQRKVHLPLYEQRAFTAGDAINIAEYRSVKIGFMTCFDAWFSPFATILKQYGAQIVCNSSCFGGAVTPTILPIRALENQNYVISCNRVGEERFDGELESYRGESQLIDPDGNRLKIANQEEVLYITNIDLGNVGNPKFGSLITDSFDHEHSKYKVSL